MAANAVVRNERRKYWYDARILVNGRLVAPLSEEYHGKVHTYDYYGCRCDPCSLAAQKRNAARSKSQRKAHGPGNRAAPRPDPLAGAHQRDSPLSTVVALPVFLEPVQNPPQPDLPVEEPEVPEPVELPAQRCKPMPVPDLCAEVPPITNGARAEITTVDQLKDVVEAYHRPQWSAPVPGDNNVEKRSAHGVLIKVFKDTGTVLFVGTSDQSSAAPESLREVRAPKSTKRGGSGSGMPTSYAEVINRLLELGCTVENSGAHLSVILPDGRRRSLPRRAGDFRAVRNTVTQFKKDGLDLRRNLD